MAAASPVEFSADEIQLIVQRHLLEHNTDYLEIISHDIKSFIDSDQEPSNNQCNLCVVVKHRVRDKVIGHILQFHVKVRPAENLASWESLDAIERFEKELNAHRRLILRLEIIHIGRIFAPKCYLVCRDMLVFEDFSEKEFQLVSSPELLLDYHHLIVAMRILACMHSASIVLESRTKKSIPELYPKCVAENVYLDEPNCLKYKWIQFCIRTLAYYLQLLQKPTDASSWTTKMQGFALIMQRIFDLAKVSLKFRNVFSHGNLSPSNLVFRYEGSIDSTRIPVDCRLVDFQFCRYIPPAWDVLCVVYSTSARSFRENHLKNLLDAYYSFLEKYLRDHDINVEDELPRKDFDESVETYKLAALIQSILIFQMALLAKDTFNSMCNYSSDSEFVFDDHINMCTPLMPNEKVYSERISDLLIEIISDFSDTKLIPCENSFV